MSRICELTGKKSLMGFQVSHSLRHTKKRFNPNLQTKRLFVPELKKWITVKISTQALRTIDKNGIFAFLKEQLAKGFNPEIWVDDPAAPSTAKSERGYRRVEETDKSGRKTYRITYEPAGLTPRRRVKLSSIF